MSRISQLRELIFKSIRNIRFFAEFALRLFVYRQINTGTGDSFKT
jgi:hypothetical protein